MSSPKKELYAIYHEGMKEWWTLDDNSFIVLLHHLPQWNKQRIDLREYSWNEIEPHAKPVLNYVDDEKIVHMTDREWWEWVENEPQHVTYIDELLCVLEETTFEVSHGIEDWLESLKGTK